MILDRFKKKEKELNVKEGDCIEFIKRVSITDEFKIGKGKVIKIQEDAYCIRMDNGIGKYVPRKNILKICKEKKEKIRFIFECEHCGNLMDGKNVRVDDNSVIYCDCCGHSEKMKALEVIEG